MTRTEGPRPATGHRRLPLRAIAAQAAAREFPGLPPGVRPGQLLAAFKRAAPALGLTHLRDLVDQLMAFTRPQDWERGSRPLVWPGNALLSEQLGISGRHVRRLLARLIAAGILLPADSPDGKRWGRRDESGRIVEAYGFDLAPLALRYREFCRLAEAAAAERKARAALRRRLTIARLALQQLAETALEEQISGRDWAAWLREALALAASAARSAHSLQTLAETVSELERRRGAGEEALRQAFAAAAAGDSSGDRSAAADSGVRLPTTTTQPPADTSATSSPDSGRGSGRGRGASLPTALEAEAEAAPAETGEPEAPPAALLLRAAPRLREQLLGPPATWAELVEAADRLRRELGIGQAAWIEACQALGRYRAAAAVAVIAAKQAEIRRPAAYLRAMAARGRRGQLRLAASLYGLAARQPETPPPGEGLSGERGREAGHCH